MGENDEPKEVARPPRTGAAVSAQIHAERIADFAEARARWGREQGDPLAGVKALVAARRALRLLTQNGYPLLAPLLWEVQFGLDEIARMFRRELVRRLLLDTIDEAQAAECLRELSAQIDAGEWEDWRQDWNEVEDQVCAKLAAQTAAPVT
jgi:hypothetical protein